MAIEPAASDRDPAPAVTRAVRILDVLADAWGEPLPLSELARLIGAAKSSTSNLCAVLEESRLIRRQGGGYVLGARTLEFGAAYLRTFDPAQEFYRFCAESPVLAHEVVQLAMLEGTDVVYLARHEGRAPIRLSANIGDRFPAAPTAIGNALLAHLDPAEVAARFTSPEHFPQRTERSTKTLAELQAKLDVARERGYAIDDNEVHPGVYGIAMWIPPRSRISSPLAVGVSLMEAQLSMELTRALVDELHRLVELLSNPLVPSK